MIKYEEPLYRPPWEAYSLIFQITIGCATNKCKFCGMYKGKKFRIRPLEEILEEIRSVPEQYRSEIKHIFLADGDALIYPYDRLITILETLSTTFPHLERVSSYVSPISIKYKTDDQLRQLKAHKLDLGYYGLESGDNVTLENVSKGFTSEEMRDLAIRVREAGMTLFVSAILGLAGKERSLEHARATAEWINAVNPEYFTLLTLFESNNEEYLRSIQLCSRGDIMLEALELVKNMHPSNTELSSIHASNFVNIEGIYPQDREKIIQNLELDIQKAQSNPEFWNEIIT